MSQTASSKLIRDASVVNKALKEMPDGGMVAAEQCRIQIPVRWNDRFLASVGAETFVLGIMAIIVNDTHYAVSNVCAQFRLNPDRVSRVMVEDEEYYDFYFEKGSKIFESINLLKQDTLVYYLFDEIITKGNIPWYMTYDDLGKMLDSTVYYTDTHLAENCEMNELIISLIARDSQDRTKYYRTAIEDQEYVSKAPPEYVALSSVVYSASNTLNKIAGSYMSEGIVSALVSPSTDISRIESLLRS